MNLKITNVEPILLRGETQYSTTSTALEASDSGDWQMLVKVETDEGLTGWSDVETLSTAGVAIIAGESMHAFGFRTLRDLLIGEDPLDTDRAWDRMYLGSNYYGRRGIALHCMSALDNCLWSIRAQASGRPLHELLGTKRRDRITAYASTLFRTTPEANAEAARGYLEKGFHAIKFGWGVFGKDPGLDVEILAAIREAMGPDKHLLIDPGWYGAGWGDPHFIRTREQNLALVEYVAPYNPGWVEDFIHPERPEEWAEVRKHSQVPLAGGEQLSTIWDFERYIGMGCLDVVQPDITRCGGLTVAKRVAELVEKHDIRLVPHSWLTDLLHAYSLHLIATLRDALFLEFNVSQSPLTRGVCGGQLQLNNDGTVTIPDAPGLGVTVDEDFVEAQRAM